MDDASTQQNKQGGGAGEHRLLPRTLLVQAAGVIAKQLQAARVETGADIGWQTAARNNDTSLYGGTLGIAVFLAAYARVEGAGWARDLALRAVASTRRAEAHPHAPEAMAAAAVGGLVGRGAHVYGLATIGRLLDEPALAMEAHALATSIDPSAIAKDRGLDVVHGSAGLILALTSLGPALVDPGRHGRTPLDLVSMAAEHLLASQEQDAPWAGAVIGPADPVPQSGFAHGATGVSVALARAGQILGNRAFLAAAARGLTFERTHCVVSPGCWRVAPGDTRTPSGWCRGGPGAALGRSIILEAAPDIDGAEAAQDEIAQAVSFMQQLPRLRLDHLCCGGMGVVDTLLALHAASNDDAMLASAHARALSILRAAKARGGFLLGTEDGVEPSLFQGLAGVGYGLLRLAEPALLPCVLMLA